MHDPKTVAFGIPRPWPKRWRSDDAKPGQPRWVFRYSWRNWYDLRPGTFRKFTVVAGRGLYWPDLVTVWHNEPGGADSGTVCKRRTSWRWHVHHWSFQVHPWQHFRRWAFTRCEWCDGPSRKGDLVNHSHQWHRERGPWWRSERGLFHCDCSTIERAHRTCTCGVGPWESGLGSTPYGQCASCGRFRAWSKEPKDTTPEKILQTIPAGQRDPAKYAQAVAWWQAIRDAETQP